MGKSLYTGSSSYQRTTPNNFAGRMDLLHLAGTLVRAFSDSQFRHCQTGHLRTGNLRQTVEKPERICTTHRTGQEGTVGSLRPATTDEPVGHGRQITR